MSPSVRLRPIAYLSLCTIVYESHDTQTKKTNMPQYSIQNSLFSSLAPCHAYRPWGDAAKP